jgi:hypothetical protein
MPYYTRSRARALLSTIEEQETAATESNTDGSENYRDTPLMHVNEAGPIQSMIQRESTPSVAQIAVPETPHTTNQSMLNALERAPKKKGLQRFPGRIGVHHGIDIYRIGGPYESWLREKKKILEGNQLRDEMLGEYDPGAQDKPTVFRELRELQQDRQEVWRAQQQYIENKKSDAESSVGNELPQGLGPEGTWLYGDDVSQINTGMKSLPQGNQKLGPEGTFLY